MANPVAGKLAQYFFGAESSFGGGVTYAATDAVSPLRGSVKLTPSLAYEKGKEATGHGTLVTEILGLAGGKWSAQFYLKPTTAGTAPDIGLVIKAAMGTETVTPATSVVYSLSDSNSLSLCAIEAVTDLIGKYAAGMVVEQMTIEASQTSPPLLSFSGSYNYHGECRPTTVKSGGAAGGATVIPIADDDRGAITGYPAIEIEGDATQHNVTAISYTGGSASVTITPGITAIYGKAYDTSAGSYRNLSATSSGDFVQWQVFPNNTQNDDGVYFGFSDVNHPRLYCDISATVGAYTGNACAWTYWNGSTWAALTVTDATGQTTDGKRPFNADGSITFTAPGAWASSTVDTQSAYWVRCIVTDATKISTIGILNAKLPYPLDGGEAITPYVPASRTEAGTIVGGTSHALTLGGVSLGFVSAKITLNTGIALHEQEAGVARASRMHQAGERVVEGEVQFVYLDTENQILGRSWNGDTMALSLRLGASTAGAHMTISLPVVRADVHEWSMPDGDLVGATVKFVARMSSVGADEMTITFD